MNEKDTQEKITIGNLIVRFIEGLILGFTSGVPFFQMRDLKETMGIKELHFYKDEKGIEPLRRKLTRGIRNQHQIQGSFLSNILWIIKYRWTYLLGCIIGFVVFFFIPVHDLIKNYPTAISGGLLALCFGFIFYEFYRIHRSQKVRAHKKTILITLGCASLFCFFSLFFMRERNFEFKVGVLSVALIAFISFLAGFISVCSGLSMGTTLYLTNSYLFFSETMNDFLYKHENIGLVLIYLASSLAGSVLGVFFKRQVLYFEGERSMFNSAIFFAGACYLAIRGFVGDKVTDVSTETAQIITIFTTVFACLLISFALTIHGFKFFNKKDYRELNQIGRDEAIK